MSVCIVRRKSARRPRLGKASRAQGLKLPNPVRGRKLGRGS